MNKALRYICAAALAGCLASATAAPKRIETLRRQKMMVSSMSLPFMRNRHLKHLKLRH